jgi:hypothetical protein
VTVAPAFIRVADNLLTIKDGSPGVMLLKGMSLLAALVNLAIMVWLVVVLARKPANR